MDWVLPHEARCRWKKIFVTFLVMTLTRIPSIVNTSWLQHRGDGRGKENRFCFDRPASPQNPHSSNRFIVQQHEYSFRERYHFSCQLHEIIIHLLCSKLIKHFLALFYKHVLCTASPASMFAVQADLWLIFYDVRWWRAGYLLGCVSSPNPSAFLAS